ncbi:MAG TPA: class I SAM-dependent methyltransferase [Chroococcidiopsis sp.]
MNEHSAESLAKIRAQFDDLPYPNVPLDVFPRQDYNLLFKHSMLAPYYLKHRQIVDTQGKIILDAGCGSGFKALLLAEANPGARIVGVDLSEESVKLARQRLQYHGFENCEFHAVLIEDLPNLGLEFDYINCDEVLYLLLDPVEGLRVMKSVLKPGGILRTNLHNALQRAPYYRAQALFGMMGLMDQSPGEMEIDLVVETMQTLKETTNLRATAWNPVWERPENRGEMLANHLLVGDKGFTTLDLFELLDATDLEFISMVNWRHWDPADLFKDPNNLPAFWGMSLEAASLPERLRIYELLNPTSRLLDWWCTLPGQADGIASDQWTDDDWLQVKAILHPQLCHDQSKQDLLECIELGQPFEISRYFDLPALAPVMLESAIAACLLPLWEGPQPVSVLSDRFRTIHPVHAATLTPRAAADAFKQVKQLLGRLEVFLYVMLERSGR